MASIQSVLLGGAVFEEREEFFRFQFRFLYVLLLFGILTSGIFVIGDASGANRLASAYITAAKLHMLVNLLLVVAMYGRKSLYYPVAWLALLNSFMVFITALLYVQTDELRVIWFFLNLPAVFLLLGRGVGLLATVASAICIVVCNRYLQTPYSPNAIVTSLVGFCYVGAFFYAYASRPISYFHRMLESNEKLRYMASHDPLTGVLNARTYYDICDRLILVALRDNIPFSVLFVDLDHFKSVNDTYGHDAGDTVLKTVAACLAEHTRDSDLLARIGGEEFSLFLPGTPLQGAMALAEKLRGAVEQTMPNIGSTRLKVTASIGVAINQPHHQQIAAIQSEADQAMYEAKKQGRNRVSCLGGLYSPPALQTESGI